MDTTAGVHGKVWGPSGVICFGMTRDCTIIHWVMLGSI